MIKSISLQNFRNLKKTKFEFSEKITVILGPNTSGKTNLLEAIFLLATGKSFKARLEEEMIGYDSSIARVAAVSSIKYQVSQNEIHDTKYMIQNTKLDVVLTRGEIQIGEDPKNIQKSPRKKMLVNGVSRRLIDFAGNLKIVLFGPWDMDLVTESPSKRRDYLDYVLSQTDREYRRAIMSYVKGLRQRNRILFNIRENGTSRSHLLFWDKLLIKNGNYISSKRAEFIEFVNQTEDYRDKDYMIVYDDSPISESRLEQYKNEEVASATTLVGPHRDDMVFKVKTDNTGNTSRELARFGSRGESRMGVLWLKMAELSYIRTVTGENPTLLLDDIFSELDHEHRNIVFDIIGKNQTIITTADEHYIEDIKNAKVIKI